MPKTNQNTGVSAMALLNDAREYRDAGEILFGSKPDLTRVLNFLYFHTVELLLKSYLRAHGREPWGHEIGKLYDEARQLGLKIQHDDVELRNIVGLLEGGNADMGFRYFTLKSTCEPELGWTRDVVGQLMQVVTRFVESKCDDGKSDGAVKAIMRLSKPRESSNPQGMRER